MVETKTSMSSLLVFDWLLVLAHGASEEDIKERAHMLKSIRAAGLVPVMVQSKCSDAPEIHVWIRCPGERLEEEAEKIQIKKPLQENGGLACFSTANRHMFDGPIGDYAFFSTAERQQIVYSVLTSPNALNGAGLNFDTLKASGVLIEAFPLHDAPLRDALVVNWLDLSLFKLDAQPVTEIKDYYGEEIAMYFAWAGHFVHTFFPLAVLGLVTQIAQSIIKGRDIDTHEEKSMGAQANSTLNVITALYAFIMHVFIATYSYRWARRQYNLAHQWGSIDIKPETFSKNQAPIDAATLKKWEMSAIDQAEEQVRDHKRVIRWAVVTLQVLNPKP